MFKSKFNNKGKDGTDKPSFSGNTGYNQDTTLEKENETNERRLRKSKINDDIDSQYGYPRYSGGAERVGWLVNMHPTDILDSDKRLVSAVDYYFLQEDGSRFKVSLPFKPYFYVATKRGLEKEISTFLSRKFASRLAKVEITSKIDLDKPNHLVIPESSYIKLSFVTTDDLIKVRREIMPKIKVNREKSKNSSAYTAMLANHFAGEATKSSTRSGGDPIDDIIDIREYDVPYHVRVSIDLQIFVGQWYSVRCNSADSIDITLREDLVDRPDTVVLAYDIETTKLPLKFPDSSIDQIMMISYMVDGNGYLICNREIIAQDIDNFEFTPKPEFPGPFVVFNEPDEKATIRKFFDHIWDVKPNIIVTYNGDFFDWPFVEARALVHGMNMEEITGFVKDNQGEYKARPCIHMDCYRWVKRDSYLPVGAQGLKAVAKAKLRYDPVEVDPEDMCRFAREEPQTLANYSVSDAVATYYLYMKYVHPFIFALCTIIPLEPDEVLRKGSGTLCEALLMVQAFKVNIVFPNKQESELNKMTADGHILDSETYVGGHVEALESGVFRADIPCKFRIIPEMCQTLREKVKQTMKHALEVEEKIPLETVVNFDAVCEEVDEKLEDLQNTPHRMESPIIYHLDVGAMYPNIILTNRLQPSAMVDENTCAACDFNTPNARCQRHMSWMWRGLVMPASRSEYYRIQAQLEQEKFPPVNKGDRQRAFFELSKDEQADAEKKRLNNFCRKAYKKNHITRMEERIATVCQRENSFYVDTVRAFRDRRYTFKELTKVWKKKADTVQSGGDATEIKKANGMVVLYDSLQLAHKCILNSFYGYVMRKGARWYCMEMAGIVCYTGASLITHAREIVEQIGRPLELDTDGIWCILPASFPENFTFKTTNPKKPKVSISYPGAMLNVMVQEKYTNDQYHELVDQENLTYSVRQENSIFFEVDGPYLAMILPASKEEGKKLKKRYAVFNFDGSLAELKGFEVKRNGELQLIKIFQSSVFEAFLKGSTSVEVYASVAKVADYWLDVLYSKAASMPDSELFDLISENRSMSKKLEDYGALKSTSISTARRLAEFLGDQMVKDAGLSCKFIISRKPEGAPVTERAIPLAIFQAEPSVRRHFLRKWLKSPGLQDLDIRNILDWNYYIERLGSAIQKIITIPAALQHVSNPVARVPHPDWLHKKLLEKDDVFKQRKINEMFQVVDKPIADIEDVGSKTDKTNNVKTISVSKRQRSPDNAKAKEKERLPLHWKERLGTAPKMGNTAEKIEEWIKFHKEKWKLQRQIRSQIFSVPGEMPPPGKRPRLVLGGGFHQHGMTGFLNRTRMTLLDQTWEVIQLVETQTPGVFRLWALIGTDLHALKLNIPRIFYVNLRTEKEGKGELYSKVNKTLPRSHVVHHLYEYKVPETVYQEHASDILGDLVRPEVEGVYELNVPLLFRALVRLGCLCAVDRRWARSLLNSDVNNFDLDVLQFRTLSQHHYLQPGSFKYLFLYHHLSAKKHVISLFFPLAKKCSITVIDNLRANNLPNLSSVYSAEWQRELTKLSGMKDADLESAKTLLPPEELEFDVHVEIQEKSAFRLLQRQLSSYKEERHGASLIVLQSPLSHREMTEDVPVLADFPVVSIATTESETVFGVLDWQKVAAKAALRQYLHVESRLQGQLERARYFHVPVGNLLQHQSNQLQTSSSTAQLGCDLFLARHLSKQNHVLWCSSTDSPDLGGKETDDQRLLLEMDDSQLTQVNRPGSYPSVCIDLEVSGLAVAGVLVAGRVHELEGASLVSFDNLPSVNPLEEMLEGVNANANITAYDETAAVSTAFRVVRTMVMAWVRDVTQYQNPLADELIVHFYHWLRSPQSLLYDPALKRALQKIMKKVFFKLVEEVTSLGCEVIFANQSRLIVCTKRTDLVEGISSLEFVTNTLRSRELFNSLDLQYSASWTYLLWMDTVNYAGVKGNLDAATRAATTDSEAEEDTADNEPELEMHWHLARYLPESRGLRTKLKTIIAGYILSVHQSIQEEYQRLTQSEGGGSAATGLLRRRRNSAERVLGSDASLYPTALDFVERLVKEHMSGELYSLVHRLQRKSWQLPEPQVYLRQLEEVEDDDDQRPPPLLPRLRLLPGYNPLLEFVKSICMVLSLDSCVAPHLISVKRDLLRLLGVGEFSMEAEWTAAHLPAGQVVSWSGVVVLPEVTCPHCNYTRDLDLCRDIHVTYTNHSPWWFCPQCRALYPRGPLEWRLMGELQQTCLRQTVQDLRCVKCSGIQEATLAGGRCSECAGQLLLTAPLDTLHDRLNTYVHLAEAYQMTHLAQMAGWLLQGQGMQSV